MGDSAVLWVVRCNRFVRLLGQLIHRLLHYQMERSGKAVEKLLGLVPVGCLNVVLISLWLILVDEWAVLLLPRNALSLVDFDVKCVFVVYPTLICKSCVCV